MKDIAIDVLQIKGDSPLALVLDSATKNQKLFTKIFEKMDNTVVLNDIKIIADEKNSVLEKAKAGIRIMKNLFKDSKDDLNILINMVKPLIEDMLSVLVGYDFGMSLAKAITNIMDETTMNAWLNNFEGLLDSIKDDASNVTELQLKVIMLR